MIVSICITFAIEIKLKTETISWNRIMFAVIVIHHLNLGYQKMSIKVREMVSKHMEYKIKPENATKI